MLNRFRSLRLVGALLAVLALAACAGTSPVDSATGPATSSVTVYGTADGGLGRVAR